MEGFGHGGERGRAEARRREQEQRPKLLGTRERDARPRLRAQIERDGLEVFLAFQDCNGGRVTIRMSRGGAQTFGAVVTGAANATEDEPSYEVEVIGELEQTHGRK